MQTATTLPRRMSGDRIGRAARAYYTLVQDNPAVGYSEAAEVLKCSRKHIYKLEDALVSAGYLVVTIQKNATGKKIMRTILEQPSMELAS